VVVWIVKGGQQRLYETHLEELHDIPFTWKSVSMSRSFAQDPEVGPDVLQSLHVERGLVKLAEGKGQKKLLDVERGVALLEDLQALDEPVREHLAKCLRGEIVREDPAVDRPSPRRAQSSSVDKFTRYAFANGSQCGATAPPT